MASLRISTMIGELGVEPLVQRHHKIRCRSLVGQFGACVHLPHRATLRYHDRNTRRMRIPEDHAAQFDIDGRCRPISPTCWMAVSISSSASARPANPASFSAN